MANELKQLNINIDNGETYKLVFKADINFGELKVLQGTQEIFNSTYLEINNLSDNIFVEDRITIYIGGPIIEYNLITLSENITITII